MTTFSFYMRDTKTYKTSFAATYDTKTKKFKGPKAKNVERIVDGISVPVTEKNILKIFGSGTYLFAIKGDPIDVKAKKRPPKSVRWKLEDLKPKKFKKSLKKRLFSP